MNRTSEPSAENCGLLGSLIGKGRPFFKSASKITAGPSPTGRSRSRERLGIQARNSACARALDTHPVGLAFQTSKRGLLPLVSFTRSRSPDTSNESPLTAVGVGG